MHADTIKIVNTRNETVSVCVYRDQIELDRGNPKACWLLPPGKSVIWDRGNQSYIYALAVSKPNTSSAFCKRAAVPIGAVLTIGPGTGCNLDVSNPQPPPKPQPVPKPVPTPDPGYNWIGIGNEWPEAIKVCMSDARRGPPKSWPICNTIDPYKRFVWHRKLDTYNYNLSVQNIRNETLCERTNLSGARELWSRELIIQRPCKIAIYGEPRAAQGNTVAIFNNRSTKTKVCMYDKSYQFDTIPLVCWTINSRGRVVWDRKSDRSAVNMRMFTQGFIDTEVCSGRIIEGLPQAIDIWPNCEVNYYVRPEFLKPSLLPAPGTENDPIEYYLQVCNLSDWGTIKFALGYAVSKELFQGEMDYHIATEGWWRLVQGKCVTIEMGERMRKNQDPAVRNPVQAMFYIYGESQGLISKVWESQDEGDPTYCLNTENDFLIRQWARRREECVGSSHDRLRMITIPFSARASANSYRYEWNFK